MSGHKGGPSVLSTTATSGNSDSDALASAHYAAPFPSSNAPTDAAAAATSVQSTDIASEERPAVLAGGGDSNAVGSGKWGGKSSGKGNQKKPPLTHFLCIPLVTAMTRPQLEASIARFRREVLGEEGESGEHAAQTADNDDNTTHGTATAPFSPSAVRPVGTLHLTLGVMSLRDDESIARALALLHSLNLSSLLRQSQSQSQSESAKQPQLSSHTDPHHPPSDQTPLSLSLQGLHPMQSPSRTSILYAAPHDPTNRLYAFATAVRDAFASAELLVPDDRALRLHATLVNTIYAKDARRRGGGGGRGGRGRDRDRGKFDARPLMERFDGFVWAEGVRVEGVAVCEMGAKDLGEGRGIGYRELASVGFE
ncbi:AKAP7 2'5' RNA ligase-like domain-containing protein [Phyllosticta citricarpa]|uniref:AKAP7 2'5' RNA ligase-like domain-containing protein n=2 Tax=Phyllosticta TaxID=121621 RepID=A0ABR1MMN7_9PEZI